METRKNLANGSEIPDEKLKAFLLRLVNPPLAGSSEGADYMFSAHSEFLPHAPSSPREAQQNFPLLMTLLARWRSYTPSQLPQGAKEYRRGIISEMRDQLQSIWTAGKEEAAQWRLSHFESWMCNVMAASSNPQPLPPDAPMSQALAYLSRRLGKLRECVNPGCPRPFFIAAKDERRYCSKRCAEGKPRESKIERARLQDQGVQSQISDSDLKVFIHDVANADENKIEDGNLYFFTEYPAFFPTKDRNIEAVVSLAAQNPAMLEKMKREWPGLYHRSLLRDLRNGLRGLWQPQDEATAELQFFRLQSLLDRDIDIYQDGDRTLQAPSPHAPIHQALHFVRQNFSKLRKCKNADCRHPLFVAVGKQRFCSSDCADVEQKMHKKNWWAEHGEEWRRRRLDGQKRRHKPTAPKRNHS